MRWPVTVCFVSALLTELDGDLVMSEKWLKAWTPTGRIYLPSRFSAIDLDPEMKAIMYKHISELYL